MSLCQCVAASSTCLLEYAAPSDLRGRCSPAVVVYLCNYVKSSLVTITVGFFCFNLLLYCKTVLKHNSGRWISWLWCGSERQLSPKTARFYCHWWHNVKYILADFKSGNGKKVSDAFHWVFSWWVSGCKSDRCLRLIMVSPVMAKLTNYTSVL